MFSCFSKYSGKCNAEFDTRHLLSVHTCSENLVPLLRCGHAMYTVKAHGTGDFRECTFVGTQTQVFQITVKNSELSTFKKLNGISSYQVFSLIKY